MHNHLADKRQITLILRLAIDADDRLIYGEIVDLEGVIIGRFIEWAKLTDVIQTCITNQNKDNAHQRSDSNKTNKPR
ncbi:MAG: hypothetical protein KJ069_26960 [Anaerolineae bacterium]|nr:hypothetical protein [Anaerolineae bacterium]